MHYIHSDIYLTQVRNGRVSRSMLKISISVQRSDLITTGDFEWYAYFISRLTQCLSRRRSKIEPGFSNCT